MQTITIVASRGATLADLEMLLGSAVVIAAVAWSVLSRVRHFRARHQEPRI